MKETPNRTRAHDILRTLAGMQVSRPRRTYGSTLLLDLGKLKPVQEGGPGRVTGEAAVLIQWDWRLETETAIVCGSSNSVPEIEAAIKALLGVTVTAMTLEGAPPELSVSFSNGYRLRSMAMVSGDPQWGVSLPDGTWLSCKASSLVQQDRDEPVEQLTPEERYLIGIANDAAARWGRPETEPALGECRDCCCFVYLDGDYALQDYGVCMHADSPFDGRVVNVKSGCPLFEGASGSDKTKE